MERKRDADAKARLQQWATEKGLADTRQNADLITEYIESHGRVFNEAAVDAAVVALQTKLRWHIRPTNVAVWRPGDWLPDDATPAQLHQSEITEIVAWKTRQELLGRK